MADRTPRPRVPALLDALARDGHIPDRQALEMFVLARRGATELPLHIRVLVGVAAVIACACFTGFLWKTGLIDYAEPSGMLVSGSTFIVVAIILNRMPGVSGATIGSFLLQASVAAMVTGKFLFISGFSELFTTQFTTQWAVSLAALMVTAATYRLFPLSIDRFLSSFAVTLSVMANLVLGDDATLPREPLMTGFFGLQLAVAAVLLTHGRVGREYLPIAYALAVSLSLIVLVPALREAANPMLVNAFLAVGLLVLFAWVGGGVNFLRRPQMVLASLGAVFLALISVPALMLSIGLLVVGYAKHDRPLRVLGVLLVPAFLLSYYYGSDVSLLTKSVILTGGGLALLAGRIYVSGRGRAVKLDRRSLTAIALTVVVLVLFNVSIIDRERTISNGETLFLELVPVGQRSGRRSMQDGDYMRLRYVVEDSVPVGASKAHGRRGHLVLRGDSGNVARFVRIHDGESLDRDERLVRYRADGGRPRVRIVPNRFFLREDHRELYEDAQYGMFRCDDRGRCLLVGLADGDLTPIEP